MYVKGIIVCISYIIYVRMCFARLAEACSLGLVVKTEPCNELFDGSSQLKQD